MKFWLSYILVHPSLQLEVGARIGVFDNWFFNKMNNFLEWMIRIFFELNEILNWIKALVKTWIFFWIEWNTKMTKWIFPKNEWNFMILEWITFWMNISQYNIELIKKLKKWPAMSVARVKSSRVNIETTVSLLNLHFCGTISPNFMFSTHLTSLKPHIQGLLKGLFAFFPILRSG